MRTTSCLAVFILFVFAASLVLRVFPLLYLEHDAAPLLFWSLQLGDGPVVGHSGRGPAERLPEAPLKVVGQESVQYGVGAAVSIRQHNDKHVQTPEVTWQDHLQVDNIQDVERKPAEDKNRHHDHDHPGDFPFGLPAAGGSGLRFLTNTAYL